MMRNFTIFATSCTFLVLVGCDNPGGISDASYEEYKRLGGPKILYSCTSGESAQEYCEDLVYNRFNANTSSLSEEVQNMIVENCIKGEGGENKVTVSFAAAKGIAVTYNMLLEKAEAECSGEFKILESEKR